MLALHGTHSTQPALSCHPRSHTDAKAKQGAGGRGQKGPFWCSGAVLAVQAALHTWMRGSGGAARGAEGPRGAAPPLLGAEGRPPHRLRMLAASAFSAANCTNRANCGSSRPLAGCRAHCRSGCQHRGQHTKRSAMGQLGSVGPTLRSSPRDGGTLSCSTCSTAQRADSALPIAPAAGPPSFLLLHGTQRHAAPAGNTWSVEGSQFRSPGHVCRLAGSSAPTGTPGFT